MPKNFKELPGASEKNLGISGDLKWSLNCSKEFYEPSDGFMGFLRTLGISEGICIRFKGFQKGLYGF